VDELLVKVFLESHQEIPAEIIVDMDTPICPYMGSRRDGSSTATTTTIAIFLSMSSAANTFCARV
jgi:hypothetical protein